VQNTRLALTSIHIAHFEIARFSKDYNYYVIIIFDTLYINLKLKLKIKNFKFKIDN